MAESEAEKCLKYAELAMQDKDYEDAKKSILKSLKLKTTEKGYKLLAECEAKINSGHVKDRKNSNARQQESSPQQSSSNEQQNTQEIPKEAKNEESSPEQKNDDNKNTEKKEEKQEATDEDIQLCSEIMGKTNYYEILGVDKNASEEEIKKQYKKLALKLHPDKNHAPQATEAFKKVAQALACLTNPDKRRIYDEHGNEENFRTHYREYFRDEEELDPEDLFDLLFNGRINPERRARRRAGAQYRQGPMPAQAMQRGKWFMLIQFVPFILMLVLTMVTQYRGGSDPGFSLEWNEKYAVKRNIPSFDIVYYVTPKFEETYNNPEKLQALETEVKKHFAEYLYKECALIKRKKMQLEEAKYYATSQQVIDSISDQIDELDWASCKKFSELRDSLV